ncbi:hypothetical protein F442_09363 [Phytophthora nicotianae P10297]|uniref:PiggyBac transposable element-derived protein domain-containing protein n=1 Tax=Phytophthora nicotianae P10297 TaxID=1317064 RepID=W2ZAM8_PHYNI|nr:hypothetical protein F442_09363 [Phytophthora nicotianae P10297]
MSRARYMAILNIFSKSKSNNDDTEQHWKAPLSHARNIAHIGELVRRLCAEIGFVQHETIASHDDDMIRLRSAPVGEIGPTHVRNAKRVAVGDRRKVEKAAYWAKAGDRSSCLLPGEAYVLGCRSELGSATLCYTIERSLDQEPGRTFLMKEKPQEILEQKTIFSGFEMACVF